MTTFAPTHLRCPACRAEHSLSLTPEQADEREIREGTLRCSRCGSSYPVRRGVGDLMPNPPEHVAREAAGLDRFASFMRADGWDRERIRALPNIDSGYWYVQAEAMKQLLATLPLRPGQSLVDVGSNTCWASNQFARLGLQVIALDISTAEMQGLYTSDYFIEDGTSYFERVVGSMFDMPLASRSLDYVFCCEVLHHNDASSLRRTFQEAYRVLKPGGKLLVVNETLKTLRDPVGVHTEGVEQFEGYEHAFWAWQYRWEATRAGFLTRLLPPSYHRFFTSTQRQPPPFRVHPRVRLLHELRKSKLAQHVYLSYLNHVQGDVQLSMIASKTRIALPRASPRPRWRRESVTDSPPRTAPSG